MTRKGCRVRATCRTMAAAAWVGCLACATSYQFEVADIALRSNVEKAFDPEASFTQPPQTVYGTLVHVLEGTNAHILARDEANGFVSWDHPPTWFHALSTAGVELPAARLVHGSARVRPAEGGARVSLYCVGRSEPDGAVLYSNGDYERALLALLSRKVGANH